MRSRPNLDRSRIASLAGVAVMVLASLAGAGRPVFAEHTFEIVKSFELPDSFASDLTLGPDGALYGTTRTGGAANLGTVFRVELNGTFTRLHSFDANDGQGGSALVLGSDGAFYGTSFGGGSFGRGVVFRIDSEGNFALVHSFSGPDGAYPASALVVARDGSTYGTTGGGGSFDRGTLFRVDRAGSFTSLRSFDIPGGVYPYPYLVLGEDGTLYGVVSGGYYGYTQLVWYRASIFRIERDGTFVPVHTFDDGDQITNPVATGTDGSLYGATRFQDTCCGRSRPNAGSLFKLDRAGTFTILHTFDYDAWSVGAPLFVATDGALYGWTELRDREAHGFTTLFEIDPSGNFTSLYSTGGGLGRGPLVVGSDGAMYGAEYNRVFKIDRDGTITFLPFSGYVGWVKPVLVLGDDGALYGTTDGQGVVFRVDTTGIVSTVHTFDSADGFDPQPVLAVGGDGAIYGATYSGGALGEGTLFKVDRTGAHTLLHDFDADDLGGGYPPYYFPPLASLQALTRGGDGAVYGITPYGGDAGAGQVFKVDRAGTFAFLHSLRGGNATYSSSPPSSLVLGGDGALYGSGYEVFRIDRAGLFTSLIESFDIQRCSAIGQYPWDGYSSPVALGGDGSVYGINTLVCLFGEGGSYSYDNIFRADGEGNVTFLHSFADNSWYPPTSLTMGSDGALYGTRTGSEGSIFRLDSSGNVTTVHSFPGYGFGPSPFAPLLLGGDGALYGTTPRGGTSDRGTIFRIDRAATFETVHSFSGPDGSYAVGPLVRANNNSIYGTTLYSGTSNAGTVFEVDSAGSFRSVFSYSNTQSPVAYGESHFVVAGDDCALYGVAAGGPAGGGILYRLFEPGHLCQRIQLDPISDHALGDPPFSIDATASSGLPVSFSTSGNCSIIGDQVTLTGVGLCTLTASQVGDADYEPAREVVQAFRVLFDFAGFLPPVRGPAALNPVNAGRVVPVSFQIAGDPGANVLEAGRVRRVACDTLAPEGGFEPADSPGATALDTAASSGQYALPWKTKKSWAGTCRELALELIDGSAHSAYFTFRN